MPGEQIYADTSGFLALMDADDQFHPRALAAWESYGVKNGELWTSDYVRLETWTLVLRRLGSQAAVDFHDRILPLCRIHFVGPEGFENAVERWRLARRRQLSLVDVTSFDCMRRHSIEKAFAFDKHFSEEGFQLP